MQPAWRFFHRYEVASDAFQLHVRYEDHAGHRYLVKPMEVEAIVPGQAFAAEPMMGPAAGTWGSATPTDDVRGFLQAALEAAWEIGLRPKGFADSGNELKAVRYHLEDMRALAKVPAR